VLLLATAVCAAPAPAATNIAVDFAQTSGSPMRIGCGVLHSMTGTQPPDALVAPLRLNNVRVDAAELYSSGYLARLTALGVQNIQLVLSDYEYHAPWPGDGGNWSNWELRCTLFAQDAVNHGLSGRIRYDIWNEPDISSFWGAAQSQFFEAWKRGVAKVRATDPNALVVGPSITGYNETWLRAFLTYARDNGALPDILSWHELSGTHGINLPSRVDAARSLVQELGISDRVTSISINEYAPQSRQFYAGTLLSYISAMERAAKGSPAVEGACHSCWGEPDGSSNCSNASLNGLLAPGNPPQPRSTWWTLRAYAQLNGELVRLVPASLVDGIAAYDSAAPASTLLVGNYSAVTTETVALNLANLPAALVRNGMTRVTVTPILNSGTAPLAQPLSGAPFEVAVTAGSASIALGQIPLLSVMEVRLSPPPVPSAAAGEWWWLD
jgi:hypothetical protein